MWVLLNTDFNLFSFLDNLPEGPVISHNKLFKARRTLSIADVLLVFDNTIIHSTALLGIRIWFVVQLLNKRCLHSSLKNSIAYNIVDVSDCCSLPPFVEGLSGNLMRKNRRSLHTHLHSKLQSRTPSVSQAEALQCRR